MNDATGARTAGIPRASIGDAAGATAGPAVVPPNT